MVNVSAECRPLHRPRYLPIVGRYVDHYSADISVDSSVDMSTGISRPICRPMHRSSVGRYFDRHIGRRVHKIHTIPKLFTKFPQKVSWKCIQSIWCLLGIAKRLQKLFWIYSKGILRNTPSTLTAGHFVYLRPWPAVWSPKCENGEFVHYKSKITFRIA